MNQQPPFPVGISSSRSFCTLTALAAFFSGLGFLHAAANNGWADDQLRAVQRQYTETIQPLLQKSCGDCHTGDSADAGFNLDQYQTLEQILGARKKWQKVEHRVAAHEMPPPDDAEPLTDPDYQTVMKWLDELLHSVDCTNINPGRVTLRRLNRTEYRNTVRDLIGIDYKPAADFPGDDVGYGFDNIADVISLPPILMEKYLNAAEEITQLAIVDPDRPTFEMNVLPKQFKTSDGASESDNRLLFFSNATATAQTKLPEPGKYRIIIGAYEDRGGNEPSKMAVGFNNIKPVQQAVDAGEDAIGKYEVIVNAKANSKQLEISFLNDAYQEKENGNAGYDRNLFITSVQIEGPLGKLPDSHQALFSTEKSSTSSRRNSDNVKNSGNITAEETLRARSILNRFASRAFRRIVTKTELDQLMQFYQTARTEGDGFEVAMRFPIQAILVSPHFLYKIEAPVTEDNTRYLSDFELATSLSYFLWSTMPDDELFRVAAEGKLRTAANFRSQLNRMLADPRSSALLDNFVTQWLHLRHLEDFQPDPDKFPGVDRELRRDMITETKLVVGELIKQDAPLTDLLETDFTYLNQRLAKFYGISGVVGENFRRVSTKKLGRSGLMTHASVLTLTSNPTRTSPVKRGKWIMENLLGEEPPPPDPKAMALEDQAELTGTIRQRLEQHRADPNCAVCHKVMDELGFALENFDAVGRWRDRDEGQPIDPRGLLPDGSEFSGAWEMQQTIRTKMHDQFIRCLTEKMMIFATGRGMEYFDDCAVDKIMLALKQKDYRFSELIYQVVASDPFLKRRGE